MILEAAPKKAASIYFSRNPKNCGTYLL